MAKPIELEINGKRYAAHCDPETPLLSALRDELALTGTSMAVAKDNAARAPSCWTARRADPARLRLAQLRRNALRLLKASKKMGGCIQCSRRSWMPGRFSAPIAPQG